MATNTTYTSNRTQVNTTDATVTTIASFTPKPNRVIWVEAKVIASQTTDFTEGATYWRQAAFRVSSAGAVTQIGSTRTVATDNEVTAGWDVAIDTSGGDIRIRGTGAAATAVTWETDLTVITGGAYIANYGPV